MTLALAIAALAVAGGTSCAIGNSVPDELIRLAQSSPRAGEERPLAVAEERLRQGKTAEAKSLLLRGGVEASRKDPEAASLLALAHAADGEPKAAADWARRALALEAANPRLAAQVSLNAAFAFAESGDANATRKALAAARNAAVRADDADIAAAAAVNLALLESRVDGNALDAARDAREAIRRIQDPARRASYLVAAGLALVPSRGSSVQAAEELAGRLLADAYADATQARDPRLMAHALGLHGELQLRTGNPAAARETLLRATRLSRVATEDPWRFRWTWLLGLAQRELGDAQALATLEESVALLEAEKGRRSFAAFASLTLSRDYGRVYRDLVDLLLSRAARSEDAGSVASTSRAREVLELSHTAEIQDFFRDPCIVGRSSPATLQFPRNVAVVYPVVFAARTEILVVHASGVHRFASGAGAAEIARDVLRVRASLEPPGTSAYAAPSRRLYGALVRPMEAFLAQQGVDTLVWVPDGALRGLPFAVLHDGRSHLIEKYALAVTPLASAAQAPRERARMRVALTGLSVARDEFPALPAVSRELDDLKTLLSAPVLRDESFTSAALRATLESTPVNVVHVASHGHFAAQPGETFLLTYDGRLTLPQLRKALTAGQLREEPIDLLTLSACQTGAGDERSALGLAGAAIAAGARSVIGTLWSVADESTATVVHGFYQRVFVRGQSKAEALRQAQLDLMKDERFAHPAYWAPYLLIGNWN
jgi:CHAT domain-containing protein